MRNISLDCSEAEARTRVKAAFEGMGAVKAYHERDSEILGKTGVTLRSYGYALPVTFEAAEGSGTTVDVSAKTEPEWTITGSPARYEARFASELEAVDEGDVERLRERLDEDDDEPATKEVRNGAALPYGTLKMTVTVLLVVFWLFSLQFGVFGSTTLLLLAGLIVVWNLVMLVAL